MTLRLPRVNIIPPLIFETHSYVSSNIRKWMQTYINITEEIKSILITTKTIKLYDIDIFNHSYNNDFQLLNEIKELHNKNIGFRNNILLIQKQNNTFIFSHNSPTCAKFILNNSSFNIKQTLCDDITQSTSFNFMFFDLIGLPNSDNIFESNLSVEFHKCIQFIIRHLNEQCNTLFKINVDICEQQEQFIYLLSYLFEGVTFTTLESNNDFQFYIVCEKFIVTQRRKYIIYTQIEKFMNTSSTTFQPRRIYNINIPDIFHSKFNNFLNIITQQRLLNTHNLANYIHTNLNNGFTEENIIKKIVHYQEQKIYNWNVKYY